MTVIHSWILEIQISSIKDIRKKEKFPKVARENKYITTEMRDKLKAKFKTQEREE